MTRTDQVLLDLTRSALLGEPAADPELTPEEWRSLLNRAEAHKLLPMILDAATPLPSLQRSALPEGDRGAGTASGVDLKQLRDRAISEAARQAIQENEFLNLILELRQQGLEPLVLKGCVCRSLYPKPLLRPSVDDDLWIPAHLGPAYHRAVTERNLTPDHPTDDPETAWELSYHRPDSPLYLELHKCLFDPASPVFGSFNDLFVEASHRPVRVKIQDVEVLAPPPTEHLLFLLLHAYKHFVHSGFGLRIVADIGLFSRAWASEIDFAAIAAVCRRLRCDQFAAAVYRIGEKYLSIPAPTVFAEQPVDETALLADVLAAGIHGQDVDRLHSANITLQTVADHRLGKKQGRGGLRSSLFPGAEQLTGRYPWLKGRPWLLPAAWTGRIWSYLREGRSHGGNLHPADSLRIGRERVSLLEQYGIIDK